MGALQLKNDSKATQFGQTWSGFEKTPPVLQNAKHRMTVQTKYVFTRFLKTARVGAEVTSFQTRGVKTESAITNYYMHLNMNFIFVHLRWSPKERGLVFTISIITGKHNKIARFISQRFCVFHAFH